MYKALLISAMLGATMACSANASPEGALGQSHLVSSANAPDVACVINATPTPAGVRLEAQALSNRFTPISGAYEFTMRKHDSGGESDMVQGGEFTLAGDDEALLGEIDMTLERDGHYRARLTLRDEDGVLCETEAST
jgi:hypothetical protein